MIKEEDKANILKKNKLKKIILIGIAIVIFFVMIVFLINFVFSSKNKVEEKNDQKTVDEVEFIEETEEKLEEEKAPQEEKNSHSSDEEYNYIVEQSQKEDPNFPKTQKNKISLFVRQFAEYFPIDNVKNISNQDILIYGWEKLEKKLTISKSEMELAVKEMFGNSIVVNHENIFCPYRGTDQNHPYLYLFDGNTYQSNPDHGGHGSCGLDVDEIYYISSEKLNQNIIKDNYKILYGGYGCDTHIGRAYYRSPKDEKPIFVYRPNNGEWIDVTEEDAKRIMEQLPITSFVYEVEADGTKNLKSVEIIG